MSTLYRVVRCSRDDDPSSMTGRCVMPDQTFCERFWARVDRSGDCWPWTAATNPDGYGVLSWDGRRPMLAHRVAYMLEYGIPPDGLAIMHTCDNPPCVRPSHLVAGTIPDNNHDMWRKGRGRTGPRRTGSRRPRSNGSGALHRRRRLAA